MMNDGLHVFAKPCIHPTSPLQVTLLDPVRFPGGIKVFAREICRNDLLNFGRLHFFFPDSRLALDLSTDKTLKEARFDRHFVRVSADDSFANRVPSVCTRC